MTLEEAHRILAISFASEDEEYPDIVVRLRAHAVLWRNGRDPQHAFYCDEAADEIERLRTIAAAHREGDMSEDCTISIRYIPPPSVNESASAQGVCTVHHFVFPVGYPISNGDRCPIGQIEDATERALARIAAASGET